MSVRREISANLWFVARLFETGKFRALFHPAHFERLPHETLQEAMIARRAEVHAIMSMGARLLEGDMDEVLYKAPNKNVNTDPGWISYSRGGAFLTILGIMVSCYDTGVTPWLKYFPNDGAP